MTTSHSSYLNFLLHLLALSPAANDPIEPTTWQTSWMTWKISRTLHEEFDSLVPVLHWVVFALGVPELHGDDVLAFLDRLEATGVPIRDNSSGFHHHRHCRRHPPVECAREFPAHFQRHWLWLVAERMGMMAWTWTWRCYCCCWLCLQQEPSVPRTIETRFGNLEFSGDCF